MHRGYIKIWRRLKDSDFWTAEKFTRAQAWVDLIMLANHKDSFFRARGQRIDVKRGQVAHSEQSLAARWKWSRGKVRRFLQELEGKLVPDDLDGKTEKTEHHNERMIVQHKSNITTLITIVNYDQYQGDGTVDGTAGGTPNRTADGTADGTHLKNEKNEKNVKEEKERGSETADPPPARPTEQTPKKKRQQLPHSFSLTKGLIAYASSQGLNGDIPQVFAHFCDHHRAKGTVMLDWTAAWRTWVRNEIKFNSRKNKPGANTTGKREGLQRTMEMFARREHERRAIEAEDRETEGFGYHPDGDGKVLPS